MVSREFKNQIPTIADNKKDSKKEDNKNEIIHLADDLRNYYDALEINRAMLYNSFSKKNSKEKQFILNSLEAEFKHGTASINEFIYLSDISKADQALDNKKIRFFYNNTDDKIYVHVPIQYVMNSTSSLKLSLNNNKNQPIEYDMVLDTEKTYKINKNLSNLKDYQYVYYVDKEKNLYDTLRPIIKFIEFVQGWHKNTTGPIPNGLDLLFSVLEKYEDLKKENLKNYEIILQHPRYPIRFGYKLNIELRDMLRYGLKELIPFMPIYANISGRVIKLQ